jgi:hypothetical protein
MTKISELEERIAAIEKHVFPEPTPVVTQFPRIEVEKTVEPVPRPVDENDIIETQLPYKV